MSRARARERRATRDGGSDDVGAALEAGLRGTLLTSAEEGAVVCIPDGALAWDASGVIGFAGPWSHRPRTRQIRWPEAESRRLITPGFVDVHAHLPQYPAVGQGGLELLPWLHRHIFPLEKGFTPARAAAEAPRFFAELKKHGITSAALYASAHAESTDVCFEAARASGLRVVMGQTMMDRDSYLARASPALTRRILREGERLCARWHGEAGGRLAYAWSPRFALSCSEELMRETGRLAAATGAFVQTHLSENRAEIAVVNALFPKDEDYTGVYERCGLLGPRTVVGHAIHLAERERRVLAETGTAVAHCPTSNLFLQSGVMPWSDLAGCGLRIGLGSDVAGGPELSPWEVLKGADYAHKARAALDGTSIPPTTGVLFRAATAGGARILWPERALGELAAGHEADLAVWDVDGVDAYGRSLLDVADGAELLSKLVFRGGRARVVDLYVAGQRVWEG